MSQNIQITEALRRPIQNGSSFSAYIKETNCNVKSYGNGSNSTTDGVEFMANMIEKSSYQVKELAKKLKQTNLQSTVKSVHNFIVTYIQYEADAKMQRLRSPGCSWSVRQKGIDCKSFTIFACALLREMGYKSIIRQVKQPSFYSDQYTHVYVVVPKNQKLTNAKQLSDYYNLDGTILDNREVVFSTKKDKLMTGLPYQGMMGPSSNAGSFSNQETIESQNFEGSFPQFQKLGFTRQDLVPMKNYMKELQNSRGTSGGMYFVPRPNGILITDAKSNGYLFKPNNMSIWQQYFTQYADSELQGMNAIGVVSALGETGVLEKLPVVGDVFGKVFGGLSDLLGGLFGSDRGWYKPVMVKRDGEILISIVLSRTQAINEAVVSQNMNALGEAVAEFKLDINLFDKAVKKKKSEGWNTPTMDSLTSLLSGISKIKSQFIPALDSWLGQYYSKSGSRGSKTKSSDSLDSFMQDPSPVFTRPTVSHSEPIPSLSLKRGVTEVRSFALIQEGEAILQTMEQTNPNTGGGLPNNSGGYNPSTPTSGGNNQVGNFEDGGVKKASLIPGFSNTALIATGGVLVAGILFFPKIKELLK